MHSLGARLKEERKSLGLSQQQFAVLGGVEVNAQGKYESGTRTPRSDYLTAIGSNGVDLLYLLSGHRTPIAIDMLSDAERTVVLNYRVLATLDQGAIGQLTSSLASCPQRSGLNDG